MPNNTRTSLIAGRVRNFLIACVAAVILNRITSPDPSRFGLGTILRVAILIALTGYLVNVYMLSRALDPKTSVAWTMVALQLLPIVGIPVAISMIIKANRLAQSGAQQSSRSPTGDP